MVAIRAQNAEPYLAAPPEATRLFLVYGNDSGGVTEGARALERVAKQRSGTETIIRFGSDELSADPGCVADQIYAPSLFGGEPIVSLRALDGRHNVLGAVQPILDRPPDAAWLIVEAAELSTASPLRRAFEASSAAAAVPIFQAEGAGLAALIHSAAAVAEVSIEPAAVDLLVEMLGGDRLASRGELEKLFHYVGERRSVTADDVVAIVGETAESRSDAIIDAALLGEHEALETELARLRAEGGSAATVGAQMLRHLLQLAGLRAAMSAGASLTSALERARPPVFARRRPLVEAEMRRWPAGDLADARRRIAAAIAATRLRPALESAAISEAMHAVAHRARRLARG